MVILFVEIRIFKNYYFSYNKVILLFVTIEFCPAAWLSGKVVYYWSRGIGFNSRLSVDFFSGELFHPIYGLGISLSFDHMLFCAVLFRRTDMITDQERPSNCVCFHICGSWKIPPLQSIGLQDLNNSAG